MRLLICVLKAKDFNDRTLRFFKHLMLIFLSNNIPE